MISIRPLFSQESNIEAEKLIWKRMNLLNGEGTFSKSFAKEAIISLYELTE